MNNKIVKIESKYTNEAVNLFFGYYTSGEVAIQGKTVEDEELLFVATVALNEKPADNCVFLKGWAENEGIPEALVKVGIVEFTGRKVKTGFCEAIEAKLLISFPE